MIRKNSQRPRDILPEIWAFYMDQKARSEHWQRWVTKREPMIQQAEMARIRNGLQIKRCDDDLDRTIDPPKLYAALKSMPFLHSLAPSLLLSSENRGVDSLSEQQRAAAPKLASALERVHDEDDYNYDGYEEEEEEEEDDNNDDDDGSNHDAGRRQRGSRSG